MANATEIETPIGPGDGSAEGERLVEEEEDDLQPLMTLREVADLTGLPKDELRQIPDFWAKVIDLRAKVGPPRRLRIRRRDYLAWLASLTAQRGGVGAAA